MQGVSKRLEPGMGPMPLSFSYGVVSTPRFSTVTAAFQHHAAARPDAIAARYLSTSRLSQITYGELATRSAHLARRLKSLGVVPGDRVPLVVKRGIDMLVGIVAILSCRAQYVPLDGTVVPDATLKFVLEQTRGRTVLALRSTCHRLSQLGESSVVAIDDLEYAEDDLDDLRDTFQDPTRPSDGCYVIYTSGMSNFFFSMVVEHD
jgi:acyl-CoA synthetase (AMP-forming)/AMP-acid ligase II